MDPICKSGANKNPTNTPKAIRHALVVGEVSGSVSIIKAKKKKAEFLRVRSRVFKIFAELEPFMATNTPMVTSAEIAKLNTKSK